jgi:signal transduction histidine kinase
MIRKLRWKVVALTMGTVAAVLILALVAVFFSYRASLEGRSRQLLQQVLQGIPDERPDGQQLFSYLTVEVYPTGTAVVKESRNFDLTRYMDDDDGDDEADKDEAEILAEILSDCLSRREDAGELNDYHLRYLRDRTPFAIRIAFTDSSLDKGTLQALVRNIVLIGLSAFAVLFAFSYLLSGLITRPVEKSWQEQQRFLSDASHELKTPLTVILSSADLLAQSAGEDGQGYVDNIRSESRRMKKLVESMLTLARADDGGHKAAFMPLDWSDLVTDAALLFEPVAFEASRQLLYNIDEGLRISGDPDKLRQLTGILLDNAIKYAPEGSAIRLTLTTEDKNARLSVENGGDPIPPEVLPHLFDRFYRADGSRSGTEGFGLGLSIARSIVTEHRGSIRCESDARSTRFIVSIPLLKN